MIKKSKKEERKEKMSEKLRVMISSRCNDQIACADRTLTFTDLRLHLKQKLENEILLSKEF